jgi:hypothetical protein
MPKNAVQTSNSQRRFMARLPTSVFGCHDSPPLFSLFDPARQDRFPSVQEKDD